MTQQSSELASSRSERRPVPEDHHRARIINAEMRRLQRRLLAYGPMPRQRLARDCGAERWHEGTFEEAVREGIRTGKLRQLPLGWVEAALGNESNRPH